MLNYYVYGKYYMKNIAFQASFLYGRKMNYVELLCIWQVLHGKRADSWIGKNELCLNYYSCITQIIIQRFNIYMGKPIQNIFGWDLRVYMGIYLQISERLCDVFVWETSKNAHMGNF